MRRPIEFHIDIEWAMKAAIEYLLAANEERAAALLLNTPTVGTHAWTEPESDLTSVTFTLFIPPNLIHQARLTLEAHRGKIEEAIGEGVKYVGGDPYAQVHVDSVVYAGPPTKGWRQETERALQGDGTVANQARASGTRRRPPFSWNGLAFGSESERRIAEALSKTGVLFFPLPAAVAKVDVKEPDFVVCAEGKWGILEVQGDRFHRPETAAKEHERGRWFQRLGVRLFQIYDATRCYSEPDEVVKEFLDLLRSS
jgi:hypothetical protein